MPKAASGNTTPTFPDSGKSVPRRRAVLAGGASILALAATAGALTAAEGPSPAAELHAACAELARALAWEEKVNTTPGGVTEEEIDAVNDAFYAAVSRLNGIPARTPDERRKKAAISGRVLWLYMKDQGELGQPELKLAVAALGDVAGGIVA